MVGKTHMIIGAAAGLGTCVIAGITPTLAIIAASTLGALIPDIDHHNSKISTANVFTKAISWIVRKVILPTVAFILNLIAHVFNKTGLPFSEAKATHRGPLTHSILGVIFLSLFFLPIVAISPIVFVFIVVGMLSHIVADMFNPEGAPVLYPMTSNKINALPKNMAVTTGTKREEAVKMLGICCIGIFACASLGMGIF